MSTFHKKHGMAGDENKCYIGTSFSEMNAQEKSFVGEQAKHTEEDTTPTHNTSCFSLSKETKKGLIGLVISLLLAISWVGSAQFSQIANTGNQQKFNSPYFTTWFSTLWMIFCYPGYLLFSVFKPRRYQIKTAEIFRESRNIFGEKGITSASVLWSTSIQYYVDSNELCLCVFINLHQCY